MAYPSNPRVHFRSGSSSCLKGKNLLHPMELMFLFFSSASSPPSAERISRKTKWDCHHIIRESPAADKSPSAACAIYGAIVWWGALTRERDSVVEERRLCWHRDIRRRDRRSLKTTFFMETSYQDVATENWPHYNFLFTAKEEHDAINLQRTTHLHADEETWSCQKYNKDALHSQDGFSTKS